MCLNVRVNMCVSVHDSECMCVRGRGWELVFAALTQRVEEACADVCVSACDLRATGGVSGSREGTPDLQEAGEPAGPGPWPALAPPRLTSVPAAGAAHSPRGRPPFPGRAAADERSGRRGEAKRGEGRAAGAGPRVRHDGAPARPAAAVGGGPGSPAREAAAAGRRGPRHGARGGEGSDPGEHLAIGEEGERARGGLDRGRGPPIGPGSPRHPATSQLFGKNPVGGWRSAPPPALPACSRALRLGIPGVSFPGDSLAWESRRSARSRMGRQASGSPCIASGARQRHWGARDGAPRPG